MADEIANSDFDVNILENALTEPNLELSFPLPTDKETYLELETNDKVSNSFSILKHFIKFLARSIMMTFTPMPSTSML